MRKNLIILSLGLFVLFIGLIYAEQKLSSSQDSQANQAIEQILKAQNRSILSRIELSFSKADKDALVVWQKWQKKSKSRSFQVDPFLAEPDSLKWMASSHIRVRSSDVAANALLEEALLRHAEGKQSLALYNSNEKYYLFVRGTIDGEAYATAYEPAGFFSSFRSSEGIRAIMAGDDGTIFFHPLPRFIGSNAMNLRPVAAGLQALRTHSDLFFSQKYLGIEGKEVLGAWSSMPRLGLLIGSEWAQKPWGSTGGGLLWYSIVAGVLASFFLGMAVARKDPPEKIEEIFTEDKLDDASLQYLGSVRAVAEQAISQAEEEREQALIAKRDKAGLVSQLRYQEWKSSVWEEFNRDVLPASTGKQVWGELTKLITSKVPGLISILYRYSPSTFSLVPESVFYSVAINQDAEAYLSDARIFIGNPKFIPQLQATEAFSRWNKARIRHMPLHDTDFRIFPILSKGNVSGLIMLVFDSRQNEEAELEEAFSLMSDLVSCTTSFCDSRAALLQFPYADASGQAVAGSSNDVRSRPRPS